MATLELETVYDAQGFLQPRDPQIRAWRYLNTAKLMPLLLSRKLTLTRIDLFPDKFEGMHTKRLREAIIAHTSVSLPVVEEMVDNLKRVTRESRRVIFASCWCLLEHESEAMWRLYCGANEGVALVVPYAALRESISIENTYAGMLNYINYDSDSIREGNPLKIAMHKRREFEYEHEARIACYRPGWRGTDCPTAVAMPWDPEELGVQIVVSPYAPSWYLDSTRKLVGRFAPALADRVTQSTMAGDPT